jgi:hypothetical protein
MEARSFVTLALVLAGSRVVAGCGTDAVDVDGCKQIEEARCRQAPACGIPIDRPWFTSGTDVDSCIRYYDIACLHGLDVSDPGPLAVNACVAAIQADTKSKDECAVVKQPQIAVACGWLIPPASAPDASDAPSEASPDAAAD